MEVSRSHSGTARSPGLLWKSEQPFPGVLYLTTHNTHNRQTSMPLTLFEPASPASERPQTHALDHSAAGIGLWSFVTLLN